MKRFFCILLILLLLLGGCATPKNQSEKPIIICTLFSTYDWVKNVLGEQAERFELILLGNGADLHSFEPSSMDLATISQCALMICNGGASEEWVAAALNESGADQAVLNLQQHYSLLELPHEHTEQEHHHPYDEHTWLSLKNAAKAVDAIAKALINLEPAQAELYRANAEAYIEKLNALDLEYQTAASSGARNILVVADRYPFRYMATDYHLTCYAAFDGCSAETEAGAATVTSLADKVNQYNIPAVIHLENSKPDLAETVIESTQQKNQKILTMNSMQAMTAEQIKDHSYLSIMKENLEVLKIALEGE